MPALLGGQDSWILQARSVRIHKPRNSQANDNYRLMSTYYGPIADSYARLFLPLSILALLPAPWSTPINCHLLSKWSVKCFSCLESKSLLFVYMSIYIYNVYNLYKYIYVWIILRQTYFDLKKGERQALLSPNNLLSTLHPKYTNRSHGSLS